jgi:outer membrane protein assembly factor BamB
MHAGGLGYINRLEVIWETGGLTSSGVTWDYDLKRFGCPDELLTPPYVHRRDRASDLFQAAFSTDIVFQGTTYSSNCSGYNTDNKVFMFNAETGVIVYIFNEDEWAIVDAVHGMAYDTFTDRLFVTTERTYDPSQSSLWALNHFANPVWDVEVGRIRTAPVLRGDRIYVATLAGDLHAVDIGNGSVIWTWANFVPFTADMAAPLTPPYHDAIVLRDYLGNVHLVRDEGVVGTLEWTTPVPGAGTAIARESLVLDPVAGAVYTGDDAGLIHQLDAATGIEEATVVLDTIPCFVTAMALKWPLSDGEPSELFAGSSEGRLSRLCVKDGGVLRDLIGPDGERTATGEGKSSFHDTDTGDASIMVQTIVSSGRTALTRFDAVAGGVGPCEEGRGPTPCLEQMEFFLMGWPVDGGPEQDDFLDPLDPGKLFHVDVTALVTIVRPFGSVRLAGATNGLSETVLLSFDLSGLDLVCPDGGMRIGLMGRGSTALLGSLELQRVDPALADPFDVWFRYPAVIDSLPTFKVGVRIRGEPVGDLSSAPPAVPGGLDLYVAPNPFNPLTNIRFALGQAANVSMKIYDMSGRLVTTLVDGPRVAGAHDVVWRGTDAAGRPLSSGVYVCRLEAAGIVKSTRLTLLK